MRVQVELDELLPFDFQPEPALADVVHAPRARRAPAPSDDDRAARRLVQLRGVQRVWAMRIIRSAIEREPGAPLPRARTLQRVIEILGFELTPLALRYRLRARWPLERIAARPQRGVVSSAATAAGINKTSLWYRLRRGAELGDTATLRPTRAYTWQRVLPRGEIARIARQSGVSVQTISSRIARGWPIERLGEPSQQSRRLPEQPQPEQPQPEQPQPEQPRASSPVAAE